KRVENALLVAKNLTSEQDKKINELNAQLAESNNNLANVTEEKDSISFFGALINKPAYKGIMWGIVVVLVLILGLFVYRFKNANIITQEAKKSLAELEMEYEEHRRKALEREQKARRQLQDEINKQKLTKSKYTTFKLYISNSLIRIKEFFYLMDFLSRNLRCTFAILFNVQGN